MNIMKKNALLFGLTLALSAITINSLATVWRVNSAPGSAAHYTSIQAAHDAAQTLNGDTLYIEGSATSAGSLSTSKRLVIIGTGYFLGENPQTQASPVPSSVYNITFNTGSEGSKIMGLAIAYIYIYVSDLFITRCSFYYSSYPIYVLAGNLGNIIISQNYIRTGYYGYNAIYIPSAANNILITNNFIEGQITSGVDFYGIITNNVIYGYINAYNSTIKNNILFTGTFTNNNCVYTNNISDGTSFGTADGNQSLVNMGTVFVGPTGNSTDGQWVLKSGSPAIGAGEGGVDCGMYGGPFPYRLSGMPNIPAIYYLNAPSIPSNTINVAIKAKSHN